MTYRSKILSGIAFLLLASAVSCERNPQPKDVEITYIPVKVLGQKNWSFYGYNGAYSMEDKMGNMPSMVINGCYSTQNEDGTFSLFRKTDGGSPIPGCRKLASVGWCHDGLIPVTAPNSRIAVIDSTGNKAFEINPINGKEIIESSLAFFDGLLMVISSDGLFGYVDTNGNVRIKPKYYAAANFSEGKAMVEIPGKSQSDRRLYRFIDTKGAKVFDIPSNLRLETFRYKFGRIVARTTNGKLGFLDDKGHFMAALPEAKGIGQFDDKYYCYMNSKGDWGVARFDGKTHFTPAYETIELLPDRTFLVQEKGGLYKVLDKNGIEKLDFSEYSYVKYAPYFGFICNIPGATVLLNKNGKRECTKNLSKVSLNRSASLIMRSDYNYVYEHNNTQYLSEIITPYGVGKYKIGMPCHVFLKEIPDQYHGLSSFSVSDLMLPGKKSKCSVKVVADRKLVNVMANRSQESCCEFNREATIKMIQIDIQFNDDSWKSKQLLFRRNIRNKGFEFVSSANTNGINFRLYKAMDNELIILHNEKERHVKIYLLEKEDAQKLKKLLLEGGKD